MKMFRSALAAAVLLIHLVAADDYDLSCQPPSRYIRLLYAQDMSPDVVELTNSLLAVDGGLTMFDSWLENTFDSGAQRGLLGFTNKKYVGTFDDVCAATYRDLSMASILPDYSNLPSGVGANTFERSVYDVLFRAAKYDWEVPSTAGRRTVVLHAGRRPQVFSGLPPFVGTVECEVYEYPDLVDVLDELDEANVQLVIVANAVDLQSYRDQFPKAAVVAATPDGPTYMSRMRDAFDFLYCNEPLPTLAPGTTTTTGVSPQATTPTLIPPRCEEEAILQLLHIQDISHSYGNDLQNMKNKFPVLFDLLEDQYYEKTYALASFADKPVAPFGYPGDYCYRQELPFSLNTVDFAAALNALSIKSGRDWKESQYDAMYDAALSGTLGWILDDKVGDRVVVRVMIIATDAGPHVKGDRGNLINPPDMPCADRDYPDPTELGALLESMGIYPIFVVTSDIKPYWDFKISGKIDTAQVLELKDPADDIFDEIVDAVSNACEAASRRLLRIQQS